METEQLIFKPVTPSEWPDMQALFTGTPCWGCWCMYWRGNRKEFTQGSTADHRTAMKQVIESGTVPGLLAYRAGIPVAWVSVGPREDFFALERSRILKRIDDQPVWSIVCFLAAKAERGKGISAILIRAAVKYAACSGARIVEAYPHISEEGGRLQSNDYMGMLSTFIELGFQETARPSKKRAVVRFAIKNTEEF